MNYIVFDVEFNQDFSTVLDFDDNKPKYPFEIIQIGALKLDKDFHTISTFNRLVKPTIYKNVSPLVTELTGITTSKLQSEERYPIVFKAFHEFIEDQNSIFCTWGMSDIKELYRNAEIHDLNYKVLPHLYINIQPYASLHFGLSSNKLLRLQYTVEALNIPITYEFHNAFYDAYYTAEIFKKLYHSSIQPHSYNPTYVKIKPRQPKKIIDFTGLIGQFEKMYQRNMSDEEQKIIKLAYQMGKTQQFLK